MQKRGFTLIELLVVIAIIGVLAAILIPNLLGAIESAGQSSDRSNLSNLMDAYVTGQAGTGGQSKPMPSSGGHEFWLALFVGDAPGGNLIVEDFDSDNIYLAARSANLLRSPRDDRVRNREAIARAIEQAIDEGQGVGALNNEYTSYAGPRTENNSPRIALTTRRNRSGLVGATGARDGVGFFSAGFNAVDQEGNASFYRYSQLVDDGYDSDAIAPMFEENILAWVSPLENY